MATPAHFLLRSLSGVLALFLVTLACSTFARPAPPAFISTPLVNGLIAYLGADGQLYTIDENGGNHLAVTQNAQNSNFPVYLNPTWSFDGRHLAFVALERGESQTSRVLVFTPETGETTEIFSDPAESPFYLYWSPDNERLSFLTSAANAPHLFLRLAFLNGQESRIADTGQPYYWVWAPDGKQMFIHEGGSKVFNSDARLTLFTPEDDHMETFDLDPGNFQAPAWSPDGSQLLAATIGDRQDELILLDLNGAKSQSLAEFHENISFSWSPDGEWIAYLATTAGSNGFLAPLTVLMKDNPDQRHTSVEQTVLAYFWAPDGEKIAYISLNTQEGIEALIRTQQQSRLRLTIHVMNVQTGTAHHVITFEPTDDFLSILPVFDQYHHSTTIWSPDSTKLVFTALGGGGEAGVWVVPATGGASIQLADGTLAFWSWK